MSLLIILVLSFYIIQRALRGYTEWTKFLVCEFYYTYLGIENSNLLLKKLQNWHSSQNYTNLLF